jgi:regulator of sigma E protease
LEIDIITLIVDVVMLGILVVAHEWGHFIVARIFGIRVDEFSIGFGPRALHIAKLGDTEYNIRWVPLGGYVKIGGMEADEEPINYAKDKVRQLVGGDVDLNKAELPLVAENTPDKGETDEQKQNDDINGFYSKPIWQRALVIFAGPFMSFVLGVLIFCNMGWTTGIPTVSNKVGSVAKASEALRMGLKAGDHIVNIEGTPISNAEAMVDVIHANCGKLLVVTVLRGRTEVVLHGTPRPMPGDDGKPLMIKNKPVGYFGFEPGEEPKRVGFTESWREGFSMTAMVFERLGEVFSHIASIRQNTGSLIMIGAVTHSAVEHGPAYIMWIAGQLTFSLALFNMLPIPVLDGGHLLIFLIEALRRGRRLSPQQQQNFMLAGLVCIGILFIAFMSNDILRVINHTLPQFR